MSQSIKAFLIGAILAIGLSALAAFTEPSLAPPGCTPGTAGCDAPLNVGAAGQQKLGGLVLGVNCVLPGCTTGLIVQNGNVGIGTVSPGARLTVNRTDTGPLADFVGKDHSAGDSSSRIRIRDLDATVDWFLSANNDNSFAIHQGGVGDRLRIDSSGNATISGKGVCLSDSTNCPGGTGLWTATGANISNTNTGNVGIGTGAAAPVSKLDVRGNISLDRSRRIYFGLEGQTGEFLEETIPGTVQMVSGWQRKWVAPNNGQFYIMPDGGNVGIGTANPGYKLDVQGGWIRLTGTGSFGDPATRIGVYDSDNIGGVSGWWLSQNQDGQFAIHQNAVGDRFLINGSGNASIAGNLTVSGQNVCRQDGTNCPAGAATPNLQAVIVAGNNPTSHIESQGQINTTSYIHAGYNNIQGDTTFYTRMGEIYGWRGLYTGGRGMMLRTETNQPIRLDIGGFAAHYENAGNFVVYNPESTGGQARLGAAWGKRGVYSDGNLYLNAVGQVIVNDDNQDNWAFDGQFLNGRGKQVLDVNDSYLRLNQVGQFTSGVYTPGRMRVDGDLFQGGEADANRVCRKDGTNCPAGVSSLPWTSITSRPAGLDDGDQVGNASAYALHCSGWPESCTLTCSSGGVITFGFSNGSVHLGCIGATTCSAPNLDIVCTKVQ